MRLIGGRARTILSADYCPMVVRWNPLRPATEIQRLRHAASRQYFRHRGPLARWALNGVLWLTWPARALLLSARYTRRCGAAVVAQTGRSRLRQAADQAKLACAEFLPAHMYYRYELFRPENRIETAYLHQPEASALFEMLTRDRHEAVDDKYQFHAMCRAHGLATAPVIAVARDGTLQMLDGRPEALFVKPVTGSRGEHTSSWHAAPGVDRYQADDGRIHAWRDVVSYLEEQSRERPYLIQPLLTNDARIADLSSGPLATVRLITGRSPSGTVECIVAAFRMPAAISRHGLFSAIDLERGVLGRGDSCRLTCSGYDAHPDTGAHITGRALPYWHEAMDLTVRAHRMFPGYAFLGWDVALTEAGPVLLEANAGWDVISVQRPHRGPLMQTRFAAICALWTEQHRD